MGEPHHGQFCYPGISFTKLERHFFALLRTTLSETDDLRLYISRMKNSPSVVEILLCRGHQQQSFRLRVHGLRPVCYQLERGLASEDRTLSRQFRELLLHVLGERNMRARGGGLLSMVFLVYYPDAVVKTLS